MQKTRDKNDFIQNKPDENSGVKWIKVDEIDKYCSEEIMKPIYHKIINRLRWFYEYFGNIK